MAQQTVVQVYAFTAVEQARQAVKLGVDQIGFVAGRYGIVHAELSLDEAARLSEAVAGGARSVALTMASDVAEILRMAAVVRPDIVHVSTDPQVINESAMADLRTQLDPRMKLMKAIPVTGPASIGMALAFAPVCDYLLLDSKVDGFPGVGATGATHDWTISRQIVEQVDRPVILAGGLDSQNVRSAIALVRPWGVDSNTGTNVPGDPARKDLERIARFVNAARGPGTSDA